MLKSDLDVQQTEVGSLNKGLMLSSSFRCDQIYKYELYDFVSHFVVLLKSDLDLQRTHFRPLELRHVGQLIDI
jgi:hypothetical protein